MNTTTFKQERAYNRIFAGSNQIGGYENIHLGYNSNAASITLNKDVITSLHVPLFTPVTELTASTLVSEGAIGGALPVASDRIYKLQTGYGNTTPYGTSTGLQNGTWLCSWLYAVSGQPAVWVDRYYNPEALTYDSALQGIYSPDITESSLFVDVSSGMTLDPGVYYNYFHAGEETAQKMVDSFAGSDGSRLALSFKKYDSTLVDQSQNNNNGKILNFKSKWSKYNTDSTYVSSNYLDFNNNDLIIAETYYSPTYAPKNEFTFSVPIKHTNWNNAQSSQIAGNYYDGGFGIFYNDLEYYPYFVIPETTYGNLLFFNQDFSTYFSQDTNIQNTTVVNSHPKQISISGEKEIFVINNLTYTTGQGSAGSGIFKYNHLGDILASYYFDVHTNAKQFIIDRYNNVFVVTNNGDFIFDRNLNLLQSTNNSYPERNFKLLYDLGGNLQQVNECLDAIIDNNNTLWSINLSGQLIANNAFVANAPELATNLAVDPNNNVWVLYGNNQVAVYDANTQTPINNFNVGSFTCAPDAKNISFIKQYNRDTNTSTWYAVIYLNGDKTLYAVTLDGIVVDTFYLDTFIDTTQRDNINLSRVTFSAIGDFTGYEWNRINNRVLYGNVPQIQFKIITSTSNSFINNNIHTLSVPVQYFNNNDWYVITVIYKNYNLHLYVNDYLAGELTLPYNEAIVNLRENTFFIGTPNGKLENLNVETKTKSLTFNGQIGGINIYNYAINSNFVQYFIRSLCVGKPLTWSLPTTTLQYIETVDRFFKNKMPGAKSQFFNIKISGAQITDNNTRSLIEDYIKNVVQKTKPAYTNLLNIEWL
jgi:hypothetical protein